MRPAEVEYLDSTPGRIEWISEEMFNKNGYTTVRKAETV
jgi:hypothetical protein